MATYRVQVEAEVVLDYIVEADNKTGAVAKGEAMAEAGDMPNEVTCLEIIKKTKVEKVPD